jgi:hypothetical protein
MSFPENCIRGIPNDDYLTPDGPVGSHLFHFKLENSVDGWFQTSINWEDDDSAIALTLEQKKPDGTLQFKAGVAIVPTDEIDRLSKRPTVRGLLSYERRPLPDNPFHGNLLLNERTSKATMKLIAAGLALAISRIIPRA